MKMMKKKILQFLNWETQFTNSLLSHRCQIILGLLISAAMILAAFKLFIVNKP